MTSHDGIDLTRLDRAACASRPTSSLPLLDTEVSSSHVNSSGPGHPGLGISLKDAALKDGSGSGGEGAGSGRRINFSRGFSPGTSFNSPSTPSAHGLMASPDSVGAPSPRTGEAMSTGSINGTGNAPKSTATTGALPLPSAPFKKSKAPAIRQWFTNPWTKTAAARPVPPHVYEVGNGEDVENLKRSGAEQHVRDEGISDSQPQDDRHSDRRDNDSDEVDGESLDARYGRPPSYCSSKKDVYMSRASWLPISVIILSIYSTALSCLWFIVAIYQPRWGRAISSNGGVEPATASLVCALFSKTIEMSFVTVFVAFLGQILTRRSFVRKSKGMTLAEMTMRNWVFQPGSLITHWETIPSAGITFLGIISLTSTVAAMFYTTASEAMVAPKIKFGGWRSQSLEGLVTHSYANPSIVSEDCATPLRMIDEAEAGGACLNVQYSGQSYRNFNAFLGTWSEINQNRTDGESDLRYRPVGTSLLYDNTTMTGTWIETRHSDVERLHQEHDRIINNVTLAMPHPGVYAAATDPINGILQPDDLSDIGEYRIRAGVVSPVVNVMCANMNETELEPLIYTAWPDAIVNRTGVGDQVIGWEGWKEGVPVVAEDDFLNRTVVDDIFRWGPDHERRPPAFQLYPADFNILTNTTHIGPHIEWDQPRRDALYMLMKSNLTEDYTLCEMRSWVSPWCSTQFNISGITGANMQAHCEEPDDEDAYHRSFPESQTWPGADADWSNLATQWHLSMDLNGGAYNNDASNARILTQLILTEPSLSPLLPSMAEALAVLASSTLTVASLSTSYGHGWSHPEAVVRGGVHEAFNASIRTQEYTSSHSATWHNAFYIVLFLVFAINSFCLVYLLIRSGLVTDFTEPQNLFALALNSPPSTEVGGSCGGGPGSSALRVPWRVGYVRNANHYFFEEAETTATRGEMAKSAMSATTGTDEADETNNVRWRRKSWWAQGHKIVPERGGDDSQGQQDQVEDEAQGEAQAQSRNTARQSRFRENVESDSDESRRSSLNEPRATRAWV